MSKSNVIRRAAAAIVAAVALLAVAAPGATAAGVNDTLALANSQSLRVTLTLPGTSELVSVLNSVAGTSLNLDQVAKVGGIKIDQVISLNGATASPKEGARGFATALQTNITVGGISLTNLDLVKKQDLQPINLTATSCSRGDCVRQQSVAGLKVKLLNELAALGVIDGAIGEVTVAGAESASPKDNQTLNSTALASVNVNLAPLIGQNAPLAAVGTLLDSLRTTVNGTVLPPVNNVIKTVADSLDAEKLPPALQPLKKELDTFVEIGAIKDLPDFRTVDLLNLKVLPAMAQIEPKVVNGIPLLVGSSEAKIADLRVFADMSKGPEDAWASVQSVEASAVAHAPLARLSKHLDLGNVPQNADGNKVVAKAIDKAIQPLLNPGADLLGAIPSMKVSGIDVGGLLKVKVTESLLLGLNRLDRLRSVVEETAAKAQLSAEQAKQLLAIFDTVAIISGITVDKIVGETVRSAVRVTSDAAAYNAKAVSDHLRIQVAPMVPANPTVLASKILAGQSPDPDTDFVASGVMLGIDLPQAKAQVGQGAVLSAEYRTAVTGVATPAMAAFLLIGVAMLVRRFGFAKN